MNINNSYCQSIDTTQSKLLFGVNQVKRDDLRNVLELQNDMIRDLKAVRQQAEIQNSKVQEYNKTNFNKKHQVARAYKRGSYVMIKNFDATHNVNKKLLPKYRGPYEMSERRYIQLTMS